MNANQPELADIGARRRVWFRYFQAWRALGWAVSIFIAGLSAVVASQIIGDPARTYIALVVTVLAALQATVQPQMKARSYREAWVQLDLAMKQAEGVSNSLLDAVRVGENSIGEIYSDKSLLKNSY